MAPRAWTTPKSTGQRVTAVEFNALNTQPIVNNGPTTLTDNCDITLDFDLTLLGAGGKFKPDGAATEFSTFPGMASQSITNRVVPFSPVFNAGEYEVGAGFFRQVSASTTLVYVVSFPIGAVVTGFTLNLSKASGGTYPGTLPTVALSYVNLSTGAGTLIASGADTSPDIATYKSHHHITVSAFSHTVAAGRSYLVTVIGDDNSTSSSDALRVYAPTFSLTVTTLGAL